MSDWYVSDGKDYDGFTEQVTEVLRHAKDAGGTTPPKFGLNGFMIARDTAKAARETW